MPWFSLTQNMHIAQNPNSSRWNINITHITTYSQKKLTRCININNAFSHLSVLNEIDHGTEGKGGAVYETSEDQHTIYGKDHQQLDYLVCPEKQSPLSFFTLPCFSAKDCSFFDQGMLCCNRRCVRGVKRKQTIAQRESSIVCC